MKEDERRGRKGERNRTEVKKLRRDGAEEAAPKSRMKSRGRGPQQDRSHTGGNRSDEKIAAIRRSRGGDMYIIMYSVMWVILKTHVSLALQQKMYERQLK